MLDGKLLIDFISRIANEHHLQLEETKLRKIQEEAVEYYDYYGFNIFPLMGEMEELMKQEEKKINPEWEPPHDKWPRDYDTRKKDPEE
jgi:hypothetical protein